jgi:SAM-dependent methyltransferase
MTTPTLEIPAQFLRGARKGKPGASIASGVKLIELTQAILGVEDFSGTSVLDMGCGTKLVQALLERELPVKRYVGIDVYRDMIEFLQENVADDRFEFAHTNSHNQMYNPHGLPLDEVRSLPIADEQFDVITLFSVFTHLAPHDYSAMLKLLRPYIKPGGKLVYSLFINEKTSAGLGLIDRIDDFSPGGGPESAPERDANTPDFLDLDPAAPLKFAVYSRPYAISLIEDTGWSLQRLEDPLGYIQHHAVCVPGP